MSQNLKLVIHLYTPLKTLKQTENMQTKKGDHHVLNSKRGVTKTKRKLFKGRNMFFYLYKGGNFLWNIMIQQRMKLVTKNAVRY